MNIHIETMIKEYAAYPTNSLVGQLVCRECRAAPIILNFLTKIFFKNFINSKNNMIFKYQFKTY